MFERMHGGPVFALAQIQDTVFEGCFPNILPNAWGNSFQCECMLHLYHTRGNAGNYFEELFMYWLCVRGTVLNLASTITVTGWGPFGMNLQTISLYVKTKGVILSTLIDEVRPPVPSNPSTSSLPGECSRAPPPPSH